MSKIVITCPNCHSKISLKAGEDKCICPACHTEIDVKKRQAQESLIGKASVIQWDAGLNNVFIYRHPIERFGIGSQLIVAEGQKAVLFRDGKALDIFGPGRHTLVSEQLPLMRALYRLPTGTEDTFDSRIYFIKTTRLNVGWGVPSITLIDKTFGFHVDFGCSGEFQIQVKDDPESPRKLLSMLIGSASGEEDTNNSDESIGTDYISRKFGNFLVSNIQDLMAEILIENNINVLDVDSKKSVIGNILREKLNQRIFDEYGMAIPENFFAMPNLRIHNTEEVEQWRKQEAGAVLRVREEDVKLAEAQAAQKRKLVEAETEAGIKIAAAKGEGQSISIVGAGKAEAYGAQATAEAEEMKKKGFTYGQQTAREVGVAAASNESAGGPAGAGSIVTDIAKVAVGLGIGTQIARELVEVVKPILSEDGSWECPVCHHRGNKGGFCESCGAKKAEEGETLGWKCPKCQHEGNKGNFCESCGAPKPAEENVFWTCPNCHTEKLTGNFCPNCGAKKGTK